MATIEEEVVQALRAMDDRSKLVILRAAQAQAAACPAIQVASLRLAAPDFGGGALLHSPSKPNNIRLSLVRSFPE